MPVPAGPPPLPIDVAAFAALVADPAARRACALLDVRDDAAFAAGHLAGSGHLPAAALRERRGELPPRNRAIVVVADRPDAARAAAEEITAGGWQAVSWLEAPLGALAGGLADSAPAVRLWQPSPFLETVLPLLPRGRVLDLAAGVGREAAFLALHGFEVEVWDHDPEALRRAGLLAGGAGVRLAARLANLEDPALALPESAYTVVMVFRFLHRPLFPAIARAVAPGGCLVYETFRRGQERFGHPTRPRFLLADGELALAFPELVVERYEETDPPAGPVMARLLARSPG